MKRLEVSDAVRLIYKSLSVKGIILQCILNSRVTAVCTPFHKWLCKNVAANMWKFNKKFSHTTFIYQLMLRHVSALTVGHLQGDLSCAGQRKLPEDGQTLRQ